MMDIIKKSLFFIKSDNALVKQLYLITLAVVLLLVIVFAKDLSDRKTYIVDNSGNIVGFERQNINSSETFSFNLIIDDGRKKRKREVTINKSPVSDKKVDNADDAELDIDAELTGEISDMELSRAKRIMLPLKLSDGTKLRWLALNENSSSLPIIIAIYLFLVAVIVYDKLRRPVTDGELTRAKILKGLPRFANQLLLMLNSGMILNDALETIANSYRLIPEDKRDYFEKEYLKIIEKYRGHRISPANKITELAVNTNVKELIRIASILYENEKRGFDITDNLSRESGFLWEDRKIIAKERGKMIDTKMSYPLGILLLLLIVITMAPAMLTM